MTVNRSHTETVRRRFERDGRQLRRHLPRRTLLVVALVQPGLSQGHLRALRDHLRRSGRRQRQGRPRRRLRLGRVLGRLRAPRRAARRRRRFLAGMLEIARQEAVAHGVADRCEFRREDFMTAAFDEAFDVGIAMGVFDYLPEPVPFLAKMASLTSGKIIASFPGHSLVREPLRTWRYRLSGKGAVCFYHRADVARIAAAAGLREPRIIPSARRAPASSSSVAAWPTALSAVSVAGSRGVTPLYADLESALILPIDPPRRPQG